MKYYFIKKIAFQKNISWPLIKTTNLMQCSGEHLHVSSCENMIQLYSSHS
jgi:hypothetical protein